jgi:hypothetical protein
MAADKKTAPTKIVPLDIGKDIDPSALIAEGYESHGGELVKLEPGQALKGILKSKGSYESTDGKTGEVKQVPLYEIEVEKGTVARLIGTTAMEAAFAKIPLGDVVVVARYPDKKSNRGRVVHDIRVFNKSVKN